MMLIDGVGRDLLPIEELASEEPAGAVAPKTGRPGRAESASRQVALWEPHYARH